MADFQLTKQALQDLREIGRYTQEQWGQQKRRAYLSRIDDAFSAIAENPKIGRSADHIRAGYRCYPVGKHLVFYQQKQKTVLIVRVLHQSMDIVERLEN